MMDLKKKNIAPPEKFFKSCVGVWFKIFAELLPPIEIEPGVFEKAIPSFVGAEPRHMKSILKELRERAESRSIVWTEKEANNRFELFLRRAWEDDFVSKNFMLRIISNCRTKIFNNQITPKRNGRSETHQGFNPINGGGNKKLGTSEARIKRAKDW